MSKGKTNNIIKRIVDTAMTVLLLFLMACFTGNWYISSISSFKFYRALKILLKLVILK